LTKSLHGKLLISGNETTKKRGFEPTDSQPTINTMDTSEVWLQLSNCVLNSSQPVTYCKVFSVVVAGASSMEGKSKFWLLSRL